MIYTLLSHWYPSATTFYGLRLRTPYVLAMKLSLSEIHNTRELFLQNDSSADNAFGSLIASNGRAPIRQGMSADLKALNAELNCKSESLPARERWRGKKRERIEKWLWRWKCFSHCPPDTPPHLHEHRRPLLHWQSVRLGWMTGHLTAEWCQVAPGLSQ